jgi:hypothetical protein
MSFRTVMLFQLPRLAVANATGIQCLCETEIAGDPSAQSLFIIGIISFRSHPRGHDLGNLEMAVSLEFFHFQQIGWTSFSAASWKLWKPPFPDVHHFHSLWGTSPPWTWSVGPGCRGSRAIAAISCVPTCEMQGWGDSQVG